MRNPTMEVAVEGSVRMVLEVLLVGFLMAWASSATTSPHPCLDRSAASRLAMP